MYIGELSKITGATPRAIRFYETQGLIPIPDRKGKYRYYNEDFAELITIIKDAQLLGFKLSEIKELFKNDLSCKKFPWETAAFEVQKKMQSIDSEINELLLLKKNLKDLKTSLEKKICK